MAIKGLVDLETGLEVLDADVRYAQVQPDWSATGGLGVILNKPNIPFDVSSQVSILENSVDSFMGVRTDLLNSKRSTGVLIPLYIYPTDGYENETYNYVIDMAKKYKDIPTAVVLNSGNGHDNFFADYTAVARRLSGAGVIVLGYIATSYMTKSVQDICIEIDAWADESGIQGIFFDEVLNFANATYSSNDIMSYYNSLYNHTKRVRNLESVFLNMGTTYDYSIFKYDCGDNFVMYENSGYPNEATLKQDGAFIDAMIEQPVNTKSVLVYGAATYDEASVQLIKKYSGWMFITNQTGANIYTVLTPYLEDMYKSLGGGCADWNATAGPALILNKPSILSLSRWTGIAGFTQSPTTTSTITFSGIDLTETLKVGIPLKITTVGLGTIIYDIITASVYSANNTVVTVAGASLNGDLSIMQYGSPEMVVPVELPVTGVYGNGADTDLLYNDMGSKLLWRLGKAYCVKFSALEKIVDTGVEPKINVLINGQRVSTNDTNLGVQLTTAGTWVDNPAVAINTTYYDINNGEAITVECTVAGGTGDAAHLTVSAVFILE
jgi:hypothetical protein